MRIFCTVDVPDEAATIDITKLEGERWEVEVRAGRDREIRQFPMPDQESTDPVRVVWKALDAVYGCAGPRHHDPDYPSRKGADDAALSG